MEEYLSVIKRKQPLLLSIDQDYSQLVPELKEKGYKVSIHYLERVNVYFDCKQFHHVAKFEMPVKDYNVQKVVNFILSSPQLTTVTFRKASNGNDEKASVKLISSKLVDSRRYDCDCSCACDEIKRDKEAKFYGMSEDDTEAYFKYTIQNSHIVILY
ncbi:hypothetical protein GMAR_ORF83 [Golden Marseillevirus]|uniref:hypothetical protein n=1 Tax=Golden Marseillevirus TaxID=1720526 RepID=UPI000877AC86|nr:hypothetical protein GMAR_ORF83 [Golden Marseillevirus]ALX27458.1 hypothetical protein GMAR_ORF83 [Golden Marseillevirus]